MSDLFPVFAATPAPTFETVPFAGTEILAARAGRAVMVPMKRFCEAVGLPWAAQHQRIKRDEALRKGVSMMLIPSQGGMQKQLALPLHLIPGFLFTTEASRYAPDLQERVRLFRDECFRVLHEHFFGGPSAPATQPARTVDLIGSAAAAKESTRLITMLKRERNPRIRRAYHGMLSRICDAQDVEVPPLEEIGADAIAPAQLIGPFFRGLETLTMMGVVWNHSRNPGEIAIELAHVLEHFQLYSIPMPAMAEMARALLDHGPIIDATVPIISNITGRHALCWVFREQADG